MQVWERQSASSTCQVAWLPPPPGLYGEGCGGAHWPVGADCCWGPSERPHGTALHQRATCLALQVTSVARLPLPQPCPPVNSIAAHPASPPALITVM